MPVRQMHSGQAALDGDYMIITLCGSARFEAWFHAWNEALSLSGHCVFGLGCYPSLKRGQKDWYTPEQKRVLDQVHKDKITASKAILVLNVFAYIGESTLGEIAHARAKNVKTYFLESWGVGCGIDRSHYESVQKAAIAHGVPPSYRSPIDTFETFAPGLWDLLPDAGSSRLAIVEGLHKLDAIKGATRS
jgi:hypothetical protein